MKQTKYISVHFNFPNHSLSNLTVQAIDIASADKLTALQKFWINTLQTLKPKGLTNRLTLINLLIILTFHF